MRITYSAYQSILNSYPTTIPEQGGVLGEKDGTIVAYYHDTAEQADSTKAIYMPDVIKLNSKICEWANEGIVFCGMIHSHLENEDSLSFADMEYISKIFTSYETGSKLYFPIVLNGGVIVIYAITKCERGLNIVQEEIEICD